MKDSEKGRGSGKKGDRYSLQSSNQNVASVSFVKPYWVSVWEHESLMPQADRSSNTKDQSISSSMCIKSYGALQKMQCVREVSDV